MIESIELENNLCTNEYDPFLDEKSIWIANLCNGEAIYQDDDRGGREIKSAWLRLKRYINKHDLKITSLSFKFRSHVLQLPAPIDGAYFSRAILGNYDEETNIHFFVYGVYEKGKPIQCDWYRVPEIILFDSRSKGEEDLVDGALIKW